MEIYSLASCLRASLEVLCHLFHHDHPARRVLRRGLGTDTVWVDLGRYEKVAVPPLERGKLDLLFQTWNEQSYNLPRICTNLSVSKRGRLWNDRHRDRHPLGRRHLHLLAGAVRSCALAAPEAIHPLARIASEERLLDSCCGSGEQLEARVIGCPQLLAWTNVHDRLPGAACPVHRRCN